MKKPLWVVWVCRVAPFQARKWDSTPPMSFIPVRRLLDDPVDEERARLCVMNFNQREMAKLAGYVGQWAVAKQVDVEWTRDYVEGELVEL